jgi:hypothetical protein
MAASTPKLNMRRADATSQTRIIGQIICQGQINWGTLEKSDEDLHLVECTRP